MEAFPEEIWKPIERSLACTVEGKRLIERSHRLREKSKRLRQQSGELLRNNSIHRNEIHLEASPSRSPLLVQKLRLREEPSIESI